MLRFYFALYDIRVMVKTIFFLTQYSTPKKRCTYLLSLKFIKMTHRIIRKISDGAEKKSRLSFDP
jgi:hypothetical protein